MTLDPLPPVAPELPSPTPAREPEQYDDAFADHLDDQAPAEPPAKPSEAKAPPQQTPQVDWAALIPAASPTPQPAAPVEANTAPQTTPESVPTQPAPTIETPEAHAPVVAEQDCSAPSPRVEAPIETPIETPIHGVPNDAVIPQTPTLPHTTPVTTPSSTEAKAAKSEPPIQQTNEPTAPIATATTTETIVETPAETSQEEAPDHEPTPSAPQTAPPPLLAAVTPPTPRTPQQRVSETPTEEEITPLRADRDTSAKPHVAAGKPDTQTASAATTQSAPSVQRDAAAAPAQQQQQQAAAPSPAPQPIAEAAPPHAAGVASAESARAAADTHPATLSQRLATPAGQVAQQIIRRVENGATRFELRLDPPELGRVDVRLEMSRDHHVTAVVAADDPATLQQLVRSAREIEMALQSAGLELSQNGLSFDLTDRGAAQSGEREIGRSAPVFGAASEDTTTAPARALVLERWRGARVDLTA